MFVSEIHVQPWVSMIFKPGKVMQSDIPTTTIVGVVPSEEIEQRTGGRSQNVARTRCKEFQPRSIRAHANHPSSSMLKTPAIHAHSIHEPKIASCNVDPSIHAQFQAVRRVIRRALVKVKGNPRYQSLRGLRDSVTVLVKKHTHVRGMKEIKTIMIPDQPSR